MGNGRVENDDFAVILLLGFGEEFSGFEAILLGGTMLGFQKSKRKKEIELERDTACEKPSGSFK